MLYNHHSKAANLGDIFKHLALVSMLEGLLVRHQKDSFNFLDLLTGFPVYPLATSGSWRKGIGKIELASLPSLPDVDLWARTTLACLRESDPDDGSYPGSSLIVKQLCELHSITPHFTLFDVEHTAINAQRKVLGDQQQLHVGVGYNQADLLAKQDLVLMAMPSLRSERFPDLPSWLDVSPVLSTSGPLLCWLPLVNHRKLRFEPGHHMVRDIAVCMGMQVTEIGWKGRNMIGCQILYRGPRAVMQQTAYALTVVADYFANCRVRHFPNIHNVRSLSRAS